MKLFFASDHAGFDLKNNLMEFAAALGHEIEDCGAFAFDEGDDYPDFVQAAMANLAAATEEARAVILGGSGQGEAICANRFPGVRAAVFYGGSSEIVMLSREHNDANVLSLGARFLTEAEAEEALRLWLQTPFGGEARHERRLAKIDQPL